MGATGPHFCDAELGCPHCGENKCTKKLVDALEAFRAALGKPVLVDSAYRCRAHNAAVGGAPDSEHMRGLAADIRVNGITAAEMEAVARGIPSIRGIGRADRQGFVHVDVRPTPTLARWCYTADGKWCAYYPPGEAEG